MASVGLRGFVREVVTLLALTLVATAELEGPIEILFVLDENRETEIPGLLAVDLPQATSRGYYENVLPSDTKDIAYEEDAGIFLAAAGNKVHDLQLPYYSRTRLIEGAIPEKGNVPCGYESTLSEGVFGSPNYPYRPPSNTSCEWNFVAPDGQVIELDLLNFYLGSDCSEEYIEVYDNGTLLQERTCSRFVRWPAEPITSSTRFMTVVFQSHSIPYAGAFGFVANFRHVAPRAEAFFLLSNTDGNEIGKLNKYGHTYEPLTVPGLSAPMGVDFDPVDKMVYYVSSGEGVIGRIGLDGSNQEILYNNDSAALTHLQLDNINRKVYWLDDIYGLNVMDFNGGNQIQLFQDVNATTGLAVASNDGYIFWSTQSGFVERLDISTNSRRLIVNTFGTPLSGIAVFEKERKFFTGIGGFFWGLYKYNYDGSGGSFQLTVRYASPTHMVFFDNYVFYAVEEVTRLFYFSRSVAGPVDQIDPSGVSFRLNGLAYYSSDESTSFQKETVPFEGSEQGEEASFHNKYFKGITVDNQQSRIFLMYIHYNVDKWAILEQIDYSLQELAVFNSSVVANPRLMTFDGTLLFIGSDGIYSGTYDDWNFDIMIPIDGSVLSMAIDPEETMVCYVTEVNRAKISCNIVDQDNTTFMQDDDEFTGITFYGSYLFGSFISRETNETAIHYWNYESQEYEGALTSSQADGFGSGFPLRYILVDATCNPGSPSVAVYPSTVRGPSSKELKMTRRVRGGNFTSFKRALATESPYLLPRYKENSPDDMTSVLSFRGTRPDRQSTNGIFSHDFYYDGRTETVTTPVQGSGRLSFDSPTKTVYPGDDLQLSLPKPNDRKVRWRFNGRFVSKWKRRTSIVLRNVQQEHAGVYEVHLFKQRRSENKGFIRVIVQECPRGFVNPPFCNESSYAVCYNGGVLRLDTETCICAPGFIGCECENFARPGYYGDTGNYPCPEQNCEGFLICQLDPYGCSCAAGYKGPSCSEACSPGTYGSDCKGICHCNDNSLCNKLTGECTAAGGCGNEWGGRNCQIYLY